MTVVSSALVRSRTKGMMSTTTSLIAGTAGMRVPRMTSVRTVRFNRYTVV